MQDLYFVYTGASTMETEVVRELKPPRLLLSYHYFRTKRLKDVCEALGYKPIIMLDSGAYSAFTKGKNIALVDYMNYISNNKDYINFYITLDVIGDSRLTQIYYYTLKEYGYDPIPVFGYGTDEVELEKLVRQGNEYIALGGTVPIKNKTVVAEWVQSLCEKYPTTKFHLLGSSSKKVAATDVTSIDSSTWVMMAVMGNPKHIKGKDRESKLLRARFNMSEAMKEYGYESCSN